MSGRLPRVELRDFCIERMRVSVRADDLRHVVSFRCVVRVPDVEEPHTPIDVHGEYCVNLDCFERFDADLFSHSVMQVISQCLTHEVKEKLYIDGRLAFEAHDGDPRS